MNVEIAQRDEVVLRHANEADLPAIDHLTTIGYGPIQESFVAMLGADLYETVQGDPKQTWEQRKAQQNRRHFAEHPEQVWVLEDTGWVFGYVTFWLFPERSYGHIDNCAVDPSCRVEGWARFMYVHVLEHFSFFAAGLALWWPLVQPIPMRRSLTGLQPLAYIATAKGSLAALGLVLAWSSTAFYPFY